MMDDATTLLNLMSKTPDLWRSVNSESLVEFTRPTRNEFLTLIESNLIDVPYLGDCMQTLQSIVAGYYLSSVSLAQDITGIDAVGTLDKLNPNRDPVESILGTGSAIAKFVGTENFNFGLPNPLIGLEAFSGKKLVSNITGEAKDEEESTLGFGKDTAATTKELSNLSVGKQYEINFENQGNKLTVHATIRLMVTDTDSKSMTSICTTNTADKSFSARAKRWWSGDKTISFVGDLLFCNDLIEESARIRMTDKSKFFENMMRKSGSNFLAGMFSLKPSVNNASAVLVISSTTAREIELKLGGSLDEFAVRQQIFKSTASMLITVIDRQWEQVTIYHRSLENYSRLAARELKRAAKGGSGTDIEDIIRAYGAGAVPNI